MVVNVAYAVLAARADAADLADLSVWGHVDDKSRDSLGTHRERLDEWLWDSVGVDAAADEAVRRYLEGGAA